MRALAERRKAGVEIRVIGKIDKGLDGVATRPLAGLRLHVRAIIRDGTTFFIGSQSLRKLELDGRREVGVIMHDSKAAKKMMAVFEQDWTDSAPREAKKVGRAYSCFRRSMTPESMTAPVREIALKKS